MPFADIIRSLFGGVGGALIGLVGGWLLAQLFLAVLLLGYRLGIDRSFNGLVWAIYIGMAAIWIGSFIGTWYSLRGRYEGAILTAALSALTMGVVFYFVSFQAVVHSDSLALLLLAGSFPVGRVLWKVVIGLQNMWSSRFMR